MTASATMKPSRLHLLGLGAAILAGCAIDRPPPAAAANTRCGDLQVRQGARLLESDGLSVTIRREPFTVLYAGPAQGSFKLHAASPDSPVNLLPKNPRELWLVDSRPLTREPGDLRLAGHILTRNAGDLPLAGNTRTYQSSLGSSYAAGPAVDMPQRLRRPEGLPSDHRFLGRLDYNEAPGSSEAGKPAIVVDKVHGRPLQNSKWPVLHLTSLVGEPAATSAAAQQVSWSSCVVFFE
jgi:hypothetical protein